MSAPIVDPAGVPVVDPRTGAPVIDQRTGAPIIQQPAAAPVVQQTAGAPIVQQPVGAPVVQQPAGAAIAQPVLDHPAQVPAQDATLLEKPGVQVETVERVPLSSARVDERAHAQLGTASPLHDIAGGPDVAERVTTPEARGAVTQMGDQRAPPPSIHEKQAATARDLVGAEEEGTVVDGIEDDNLWVLLRKPS